MTALHLKRPVACPVSQATSHLDRYYADHGQGDAAVLALRVPIAFPGLPEMTLSRDCVVQITRADLRASMIPRYCVSWEAAGGGPFPRFSGTLSVPNDEDYERCFLALDGTYEPPLGTTGLIFDRAIGKKIAESTGKDLLDRIGAYLEQSFRGVEAAKANRRAALRS